MSRGSTRLGTRSRRRRAGLRSLLRCRRPPTLRHRDGSHTRRSGSTKSSKGWACGRIRQALMGVKGEGENGELVRIGASGCEWVRVGASGCKLVQVGASGYKLAPPPPPHPPLIPPNPRNRSSGGKILPNPFKDSSTSPPPRRDSNASAASDGSTRSAHDRDRDSSARTTLENFWLSGNTKAAMGGKKGAKIGLGGMEPGVDFSEL